EVRELDRVFDERRQAARGGVARVRERDAPALDHAEAERPVLRLLDELDLAKPDLRAELRASPRDRLGDAGALLHRAVDHLVRDREEIRVLHLIFVPPTVMCESRTV